MNAPQLATSAMPKMKSPALKQFKETYEAEIKNQIGGKIRFDQIMGFDDYAKMIKADGTLSQAEKDRKINAVKPTEKEEKLKAALDNFNKAFGNNIVTAAADAPAATPTPPPAGGGHP